MTHYSFLNAAQASTEDSQTLRAMLEAYFHTQDDPEQMQIGKSSGRNWIKADIPECARVIKYGDTVVGSTLVLPATLSMMQDFIAHRISEAQLAEKIMDESIDYAKMQAIYLCSAFVAAEHRGKNLAIQALIQSIQNIMPQDKKLPLFYWAYSEAGEKIAEKVATQLRLEFFARGTL